MADVEDEAEFGSHFLDSMLEVEMTEEDGEVDILKNEESPAENARVLPPIPTFDLQSQTLKYKNTYRNSLVEQRHSNPPLVATTVPKVLPIVSSVPMFKPSPMLTIYSRNLLPPQTSVVATKTSPPIHKLAPKPSIKSPLKVVKSASSASEQILAAQFLQEVFKPEYIKNVFVKKDEPSNISEVGKEEMEYYNTCFKDVSKVRFCRIHCTICDKHLGCSINVEKKLMVHKMLKVVTCKPCSEFYGDGNFPCDTGDNCEIYCRWCGQGGALVCCSYCPRVFCKKCVRRNFGASFLRSIQRASDWACFCCAQKPLWPHRAICRALIEYIERRKTDPKASQKDSTTCCNLSILNKRKIKPMDKNKVLVTQGQIRINQDGKTSVSPLELKNKIIVPIKTVSGKEQSILKSNVQVKLNDQNKSSLGSIKILGKNLKANATNLIASRSLVAGNNIFRNLTSSSSAKSYSLPPPQLIQSPVLHGETLITPPGSRMLTIQAKPPSSRGSAGIAPVKVTVTDQTSHLDMSKIPTAKVPHDVRGLVLRIAFPDNRVQFVRLMADGNGCKGSGEFPMPEFKNFGNVAFVEENLEDSFRLSKAIFDKLSIVKEKISSRTKFTEESVFVSSANKLHLIYEKSVELFKELDKTLLENFEEWKARGKTGRDLMDLSHEETRSLLARPQKRPRKSSRFAERCKELLPSDDSDIEILDVPEASHRPGSKAKSQGFARVAKGKALNGRSPARGAPRSRGPSLEKGKPLRTARSAPGKRKKVTRRRGKRPKTEIKMDGEAKMAEAGPVGPKEESPPAAAATSESASGEESRRNENHVEDGGSEKKPSLPENGQLHFDAMPGETEKDGNESNGTLEK